MVNETTLDRASSSRHVRSLPNSKAPANKRLPSPFLKSWPHCHRERSTRQGVRQGAGNNISHELRVEGKSPGTACQGSVGDGIQDLWGLLFPAACPTPDATRCLPARVGWPIVYPIDDTERERFLLTVGRIRSQMEAAMNPEDQTAADKAAIHRCAHRRALEEPGILSTQWRSISLRYAVVGDRWTSKGSGKVCVRS